MARMARLLLLCLPLAVAIAAPGTRGRTLYAPKAIPATWENLGPAPDNAPLTFNIILKPRDDSGLQQRMLEVVRNQSRWLTEDEIAGYIAPSADVKAIIGLAIKELVADNLTWTRNGDTLRVRTTVGNAAKFFDTRFWEYSHNQTGRTVYKTHQYTFPASMEPHVHDIPSFATFPRFTRHAGFAQLTSEEDAGLSRSCNASAVTSACIRALYQLDTYTPTTSDGTPSLGILGYVGENFEQADLKQYLEMYRPEASSYVIPVTTINGATNNGSNPTVEAQIDTQIAAGIIYPLPSRYYDVGMGGDGDLALITFQYFLSLPVSERPSVISVSYSDVEPGYTQTQASSMCMAAQQLTAAGMTIVFSTGDDGVGSPDLICPPFLPSYPSGCPYILTVGGTQNFNPEGVVPYSGAGFSNFFQTPSFQSSVVGAYERELNITNNGYFNKTGRAYPDISAQAAPQPVIFTGKRHLYSGTSLSAPIVASAITLLNDLLIKARKPTVGWAQPKFYAHPDAFTDITKGGSYGCGSTDYGLPAKPGWDASSGLGTLSLPKLRAIYGV